MKNDSQKDNTPWHTSPTLWHKIKPLARQMRKEPTPAESILWQQLRRKQFGVKFRRQHSIRPFIVDFYCPAAKLIIEVDGSSHDYTVEEDAVRQEYLESLGLRVIRFKNEEVLFNLQAVLDELMGVLEEWVSDPPQSPRKRGDAAPSPKSGRAGEG